MKCPVCGKIYLSNLIVHTALHAVCDTCEQRIENGEVTVRFREV